MRKRELEQPAVYLVRVAGEVNLIWSGWLGGMTIIPQPDGDSLLMGTVADQATLHGVLAKLHELELSLLSVHRL
jgi:hypothetical protein